MKRNAVSKEMCKFLHDYMLIKKRVHLTFHELTYVPSKSSEWGTMQDGQVNGAYSTYGDVAMDTLLEIMRPLIEKEVEASLYSNYSYARIYIQGNKLIKHKDRSSCNVSATLFLGGEKWDFFLKDKKKKIKIDFNIGDLLIYKGGEVEHWRDEFKGVYSVQVFLHYNDVTAKRAEKNKWDGRRHLGIPREGPFIIHDRD